MKKTFKKQMAVVFGAIAMIGYLSVRFFPQQEQLATPVISTKDETKHMQIYMMDSDQTLVPLSIPVSEEMLSLIHISWTPLRNAPVPIP